MTKALSFKEAINIIKEELIRPIPDYIVKKINKILLEQVRRNYWLYDFTILIPFTDIEEYLSPFLEFSIKETYIKEGWKVTNYNVYAGGIGYKLIQYLQFDYAK